MPFRYVNGIHLRYESWGVGSAPLVLLHGLGSSADDWFLQLPAFAPHYLCVAVDLRGHGLSDKPEGRYSVGLFASDVAELLRDLALTPAHILGLSLGGMVAQQVAIAQPAAVRSLVLINTLPGLWPPARQIVRVGVRRLSRPWRRPDMAQVAARIAADLFPDPASGFMRAQVEARMAANDPAAYRRATLAVARFWPGAALRRLTCPALIIAGEADRVVPSVYQARLRKALPHARFVAIPAAGHACNIDRPEVVNAAVLEFLSNV
jgi:3-oxoadipate enol-lactonase